MQLPSEKALWPHQPLPLLSILPSLKPRDMDSSAALETQGSLCHLSFLPQLGGKQGCQCLNEKAEGEIKTQTGEEFSEATELGLKTCVIILCHPCPTRLPKWSVLVWTAPMPRLPLTAAHPRDLLSHRSACFCITPWRGTAPRQPAWRCHPWATSPFCQSLRHPAFPPIPPPSPGQHVGLLLLILLTES